MVHPRGTTAGKASKKKNISIENSKILSAGPKGSI